MEITTAQIKALRDETGVSVMQCKKALEEAGGDVEKARVILRKKGSEAALKKSGRMLGAGTIAAYVHNTRQVAALVQLSCETDFVSKNEEFVALARDIAMHVAALAPQYLMREEITAEATMRATEVFQHEVANKSADLQEKILAGKLDAYFKEQILLEQQFVKDPDRTIGDLIETATQKFGERIVVSAISRLSVR
ncbi:MAG: elongation factor Ts [Patescibacteria group bacterium]|nr:elongation factor Ts [Patescibacteria group bacterium]